VARDDSYFEWVAAGSESQSAGLGLNQDTSYNALELDPDIERQRAVALAIARIALLRSAACRNSVSGPAGKDAAELLKDLALNGQFYEGQDPALGAKIVGKEGITTSFEIVPGVTRGSGISARVILFAGESPHPSFYQSGTVYNLTRTLGLSRAVTQAVIFLHELSHATNRYYHPNQDNSNKGSRLEPIDNFALTKKVADNCFK
jgi:hypothetical protein